MTEFEKKLKKRHNKKLQYNKDFESVEKRLNRQMAQEQDFPEEKLNMGYSVLDRSQMLPRRANTRANVLFRIIITLLAILAIVLLTMLVRVRFGVNLPLRAM